MMATGSSHIDPYVNHNGMLIGTSSMLFFMFMFSLYVFEPLLYV